MFDMGFLELLLIGIIALIVLGPERLPKAARTVGLWIGKAKQGFDSIKTEIDRELKLKELQQQIAEQKAKLSAELEIKSEFETLKDELADSANTIHEQTTSAREAINNRSAQKQPSTETTEAIEAKPAGTNPADAKTDTSTSFNAHSTKEDTNR